MHYLLTASLLLILLWPAYALLLRYSDRYVLHRFLLLLLIGLVAALPFVDFSSPAPIVTERVQASLEYVEATTYPVAPPVATSVVETATAVDPMPRRSVPLLPTVYLGGGALLLLILLYRLFSVFSLHLRSRPENGYRVLPAGQRGQAFTFGPFVYVSADLPGSVDFSHVLAHEKVHARQWHSVDVLLGELLLCVFWFHPVAWWLRTKLRANLEYLVDAAVARRTDKRSYQLALVRQSQNAHRLALSLPFSEPTLKDRISRMTGVPQYRLLAGITAVGLLFWLGLSFLVLNGNTQHAPHATYLEATAGPGDPYYEHYREIFSGNVYSVKIYTNRMVTVDEYLQLRAILSQAKDTKLYVAKNAFDDGFSLAVQHRQQAPATAHLLQATPDDRFFWRLRLEYENGSFATSSRRLGASARAGEGTLADLDGGLGVFVNNRPISLLPAGTGGVHEVNGVNVARLGAADWPMVRVEGQNPRSAPNRLAKALRGKLQSLKDIQFHQTWQPRGTYREWYESLDVHAGRSSTVLYNDRDFGATLDFVLDTEFGPEAMIQVAYERDVPNGDIVLQVIDDDPTAVRQARQSTSREVAREVDIYLKRLPNAYELEVLQRYVSEFPGFELRLFQSCLDNPGHYTLHLGGAREALRGFANFAPGVIFDQPRRLQVRKYGGDISHGEVYGFVPEWPADAPPGDVALRVNDRWMTLNQSSEGEVTAAQLSDPIDQVNLMCLMGVNTGKNSLAATWIHTYHATGPGTMEYLVDQVKARGFADRPISFYVNDENVHLTEFASYPARPGAYLLFGMLNREPGTPVVAQIIDPTR